MRRFLYITYSDGTVTGGRQCVERNLSSIKDIVGDDGVIVYSLSTGDRRTSLSEQFTRFLDIVRGYIAGLNKQHISRILSLVGEKHVTDVFIDSSQLGILAKLIKREFPEVYVYTFFQNIEYDYMMSTTVKSGDYFHFFWIYDSWINERCACRYSDSLVVLTENDRKRMEELYSCKASLVIPITFRDNYEPSEEICHMANERKKALFVGSYFAGNIKGLRWFCNEVLPCLDIELTIVGSGMSAIKNDIIMSDNISVHDYVESLVPFYEDADFVVLPILSGGGMKVKTAESLMFGKYIIGTKQALEGYAVGIDVASECNTADEFICAVETFGKNTKYNKASRELFLSEYSYDSSLVLFNKLLRR